MILFNALDLLNLKQNAFGIVEQIAVWQPKYDFPFPTHTHCFLVVSTASTYFSVCLAKLHAYTSLQPERNNNFSCHWHSENFQHLLVHCSQHIFNIIYRTNANASNYSQRNMNQICNKRNSRMASVRNLW